MTLRNATIALGIAELAGSWKGTGAETSIASDGGFAYEKESDKHPYDEGGKKLMVIDGTTLTRQ